MPAKVILSKEEENYLITLFHSDLGIKALRKLTKRCMYKTVRPLWIREFGEQGLKERCSRLNRLHKLGSLNPMWNKKGNLHHNYKEHIKVSGGYIAIECPSWYTGNRHHNKQLEHIIVYCDREGLTEIPKGFIIHHIDFNKLNNDPDNLIMLSISDHMKIHAIFRKGATTISEESSSQEGSEAHSIL